MRAVNLPAAVASLRLPVFAQDKEEKAVSDLVENMRKTMVDPDKNHLERIVADYLSYAHSSGWIQTKAEFIER